MPNNDQIREFEATLSPIEREIGLTTLLAESEVLDRSAMLKPVGFWAEDIRPDEEAWYKAKGRKPPQSPLPHPREFIDPTWGVSWGQSDRPLVIEHLRAGHKTVKWMGFSGCRLCPETLGSWDMSDGIWVWPEMLEHYLEEHWVKLPDEFIEHVRAAFHSQQKAISTGGTQGSR